MTCLPHYRADNMVVIDDNTVVFRDTASRSYRNDFRGGGCDQLSNKPVRQGMWNWVSKLNRRHMLFAWMSLFWVGFSDFYVRMCSMGVFTDYRIF